MAADNATLSSKGFSQWKPILQPLEYTVDQRLAFMCSDCVCHYLITFRDYVTKHVDPKISKQPLTLTQVGPESGHM